MKRIMLLLIRGYQVLVSPVLGQHCRFYPSCSSYTHEAIETHGPIKGFYLGVRRLLRCHPWSAGGFDPVPSQDSVVSEKQHNTCQCKYLAPSTTNSTKS